MIRFAENLNKMITAGLGGALEAPRTEVAVGHRIRYLEASGPVASFENNIAAPLKKLIVNMDPVQSGEGDSSPDNIRPISGRESVTVWRGAVYDPSADPALTIALGQTVYGGTVDVTTGTMTVDRVLHTFYGAASEAWSLYKTYAHHFQIDVSPGNRKNIDLEVNAISNAYQGGPGMSNNSANVLYAVFSADGNRIRIKDVDCSTVEEFKAKIQSIPGGLQVCYKLAQSTALTLTPATLSTLKGDNNVWSDAGDVTLEYPYYEETEGY